MNYKNAFNCKKCPQSNGEQGCPMWWEYMETSADGNERVTKKCGYAALPSFLVHVLRASNRPAAEISAMRVEVNNHLSEGFKKVASSLPYLIENK